MSKQTTRQCQHGILLDILDILRCPRCDQQRIATLEKELATLKEAVMALPVQECIGTHNGAPYLIGYGMQAQGEWHDVLKLITTQSEEPTK